MHLVIGKSDMAIASLRRYASRFHSFLPKEKFGARHAGGGDGFHVEANRGASAVHLTNACSSQQAQESWFSSMTNIGQILGSGDWDEKKERDLQLLNVKVTPQLVLEVLRLRIPPEAALGFFKWTGEQDGYLHDFKAYHTMMIVLGRKKRFRDLDNLLEEMNCKGFQMNEVLFSTLIRLYGRAGKLKKVFATFREMEKTGCIHTAVGCTSLLSVLLKAERFQIVETMYKKMLAVGYPLDTSTLNVLMEGFYKAGKVEEASRAMRSLTGKGCIPDSRTYNMMVCCLCKAHRMDEAHQMLMKILKEGYVSDVVACTEVIKGFCRRGKYQLGCEIFDAMVSSGCTPDLITYNVLITGALKEGNIEHAVNYLFEMREKGFHPDNLTYSTLINGLCRARALDRACDVFSRIGHGEAVAMVQLYSTVILSFLKGGRVAEAHKLLNEAMDKGHNIGNITCNRVIDHLYLAGKAGEAQSLMHKVEEHSRCSQSNEECKDNL